MLLLAGLALLLQGAPAHAQSADEYAAMLESLAQTSIDDGAFAGASGAMAVNMAAGDFNLQANARAIAVGEHAAASAGALQHGHADVANAPDHATAVISGTAFQGASGLASINQASGTGNAELNAITVALAERGIRETPDAQLASMDFASAGVQAISEPGAARTQTRRVGVERSALQGFGGILQLNQVAGARNATENRLVISVQQGPPPGF
ncbi:MAG: hypothetical protein GX805_06290 [Gammaproteobacteria bacterium]|nr:hypothetical protein [Gammaproteobacteria bacterium]